MEGLTLLQEAVGKEKRPLSWVLGAQQTEKAAPLSMRDSKRAERQKITVLRSPDEV
jgi:NADH-quinone oxidoreductase subunit B